MVNNLKNSILCNDNKGGNTMLKGRLSLESDSFCSSPGPTAYCLWNFK